MQRVWDLWSRAHLGGVGIGLRLMFWRSGSWALHLGFVVVSTVEDSILRVQDGEPNLFQGPERGLKGAYGSLYHSL